MLHSMEPSYWKQHTCICPFKRGTPIIIFVSQRFLLNEKEIRLAGTSSHIHLGKDWACDLEVKNMLFSRIQ